MARSRTPTRSPARGLRYVRDDRPGWMRRRRGRGFVYLDQRGRELRDPAKLGRIASLVIPPAWVNVWICPDARGHLQATGRDDRGRKVYLYHDAYRAHRDAVKYDRLAQFALALPRIRRRVARDLRRPGMDRDRMLAMVIELLQATRIRVGNDQYAQDHNHFGLTTLRRKHVAVNGQVVTFNFTGKSGKEQQVTLRDPRLARAIRRCYDMPGYELFRYKDDDGRTHRVDSADVNDWLRQTTGEDFTAKDFRTWAGTVTAANVLCEMDPPLDETDVEKNIVAAVKATAAHLGNTPATCRKFYIHPLIFDAYRRDALCGTIAELSEKLATDAARRRMWPEEAAVLAMLRPTTN